MAYNKNIEKSEEALCGLLKVYNRKDDEDNNILNRFLDGLESGNIRTEEQIVEFTNFIRKSDGLTQLELSRLERLYPGFIEDYATNYNNYIDTVHFLTSKMRSSISRGMKVLEKFCSKKRKKGDQKSKRKVISNSTMAGDSVQTHCFGLKYYIDKTKILYDEIVNYMNDLKKCINLCIAIIEDVEKVRNNPELAAEIYDNSYRNTVKNNRKVIQRLIAMKPEVENDFLKKKEECIQKKNDLNVLKAKLYHTLDMSEWIDACVCEEVMKARSQEITNQERALWGDDIQKVKRVRIIIEHLDELEIEGHKGKIDGMFLYMFYDWCFVLPNRGMDTWYEYFYNSYHGRFTPCKTSAMKAAKKKMLPLLPEEDYKQREEFKEKLNEIIYKYMKNSTEETKEDKKTVNF